MARKRIGALIGVATVTLTLGGVAVAQPAKKAPKVPAMTTVATTADSRSPVGLVDSAGTVSALWIQAKYPSQHLAYARKTSKATHFTTVALPGDTSRDTDPFIYEPSHGVLEIIATYNASSMVAWRSANDGASWTSVNTDGLTTKMSAAGYYAYTSSLIGAPGGAFANSGSGEVVEFNPDLTSVTAVTPIMAAMDSPYLARSSAGTIYQLGWGSFQASVPYEAGTHAGNLAFPTCPSGYSSDAVLSLAAGASSAVVVEAACGHVWSRTVSPIGVVGKLVTIGRGVLRGTQGIGAGGNANQWGDIAADSKHHFTAAWAAVGGDVQVAHSNDGVHWKTQQKLVPTAYTRYSTT